MIFQWSLNSLIGLSVNFQLSSRSYGDLAGKAVFGLSMVFQGFSEPFHRDSKFYWSWRLLKDLANFRSFSGLSRVSVLWNGGRRPPFHRTVRQRISFKILLIVYKALLGQTPSYISELLKFKSNEHTHNLRSSLDTLLLQIPSYKTKITLGDRAFACAAPKLWNNLPLEIRKSPSVNVFKSKLKAHLFI